MFDKFEKVISLRGCLGDADNIHHPDLDEVKGWLKEATASHGGSVVAYLLDDELIVGFSTTILYSEFSALVIEKFSVFNLDYREMPLESLTDEDVSADKCWFFSAQ
ncbi:hypothetical protein ACFL1X_14965 [Candidatus Hydrogenedentota bacterium]